LQDKARHDGFLIGQPPSIRNFSDGLMETAHYKKRWEPYSRGKQGPSIEREYQEGILAQQMANIALHIRSREAIPATSSSSKVKHLTNKHESKKAVRGNNYLFKGSISLNRTGCTGVLEFQDSFHLAGTCSKTYCTQNITKLSKLQRY